MEEIADEFRDFLSTIPFYPFRIPLLSNVSGLPFSDCRKLPERLAQHLVRPVQWSRCLEQLERYGVTSVIEMSPMRLLSSFVDEDHSVIHCYCYGISKERQELDDLFQSDPNYAKDIPNFLGRCLCILASTENKNKDTKRSNAFRKSIKN